MLKPGDRFGDYKVIRLLGKGGMGSVFLLENDEGSEVAAKILDPATAGDHEARKRFLREAELALGVKHPNLIETFDVGEDPETGFCYILMEYAFGGSLADRIKMGPMAINDAIRIVYQIASVLELARQKGIVHRDIKPGNIMFGADGKAKLADLGIARGGIGGTETTTVTQTGMMIGTPAYMAPEQMLDAHHVDTRADIYSLGIVFYEMLTGKRPNHDDTVVQLMAKAVAGEPIPDVRTMRPEVSAAVAELVSLMCAMNAEERISTPAEVTTAISQIVHGREVTIVRKRPGTVAKKPAAKGRRRNPFPWKVLIPTGLLAGLAAAFAILAPRKEEPERQKPPSVKAEGQTVVRTNVIEKIVEKTVDRPAPKADEYRSPYVLKKISTLGPNTQKRLQDMGSRRRSGERRGVMVFGTLKVDGKYDGKDVASWAWMGNNGWFSADIWPRDGGAVRAREGRRLLFLRHGYEPLELDLSREADREWSADEAYDLGALEMRRLSEDRQCTLSLTVQLPPGIQEGELRLRIDNRKPCGYDWGLYSSLQKPSIEVLRKTVSSGEQVRIDGCTPTDYKLEICAEGCVRFKKDIDVSDATARNLKTVSLLRVKRAMFAVRPFSGGEWKVMSVLADNDQSLYPGGRSGRHVLRLDPYACDRGLSVSSFHQPSTYDDYGAVTTNMLDRQLASGAQAAPISLRPRRGAVDFFPGRIYRFRNSHLPIDTLIAFLEYREEPLKSPVAEVAGRKTDGGASGEGLQAITVEAPATCAKEKAKLEEMLGKIVPALNGLMGGTLKTAGRRIVVSDKCRGYSVSRDGDTLTLSPGMSGFPKQTMGVGERVAVFLSGLGRKESAHTEPCANAMDWYLSFRLRELLGSRFDGSEKFKGDLSGLGRNALKKDPDMTLYDLRGESQNRKVRKLVGSEKSTFAKEKCFWMFEQMRARNGDAIAGFLKAWEREQAAGNLADPVSQDDVAALFSVAVGEDLFDWFTSHGMPSSPDRTRVKAKFTGASTPAGWLDDLEIAKARAKASGKMILAAFEGSDWCGWCKKMEKDVYTQPDFMPRVTPRFVPVYIDKPRDRDFLSEKCRERNPELHGEYNIRGVPCVVILDAEGKEIGRVGGYKQNVDALMERVDALVGRAQDPSANICADEKCKRKAGGKTSTPAGMTDDFEASCEQAKKEKKRILLVFSGSDWCGFCKRLDDDVLSEKKFIRQVSRKYVPVYVDNPRDRSLLSAKAQDQNPGLVDRYSPNGYPTVVVTDADGEELARFSGYGGDGSSAFMRRLEDSVKDAERERKRRR